jgi:hypothetical protein
MDETDITTVQKRDRVAARRGFNHIDNCPLNVERYGHFSNRKHSATIFILPRVHFRAHVLNDALVGSHGDANLLG